MPTGAGHQAAGGVSGTEGSVPVAGSALAYRLEPGEGEPILLLHPWFGCPAFWDRTVPALAGRPRYVLELYSLGEGEWDELAGPEGIARAVLALLDAERIDRCTVIGNSMGGIAAQALAASAPERVSTLVLVGTGATAEAVSPDFRAELDEWIEADPDGARSATLVGRLLARLPPAGELERYVDAVRRANRAFMAETLLRAFDLDLRPRLPAIRARTLVVRGALDAARTRVHVRDLLRGIPESIAVEIPGAGHSPMVDSPDAFVPLVRAFLAGEQVPGASRELA